jgi:hypothetical protein
MKFHIFKIIFIIIITVVIAQKSDSQTNIHTNKKDKNLKLLSKIIPAYYKLQYAGSMGMFSIGCGWEYSKKKFETEVFAGFAPTPSSRPTLLTFTLKENYIPLHVQLNNAMALTPFITGIYFNAIVNDTDLFYLNPNRFPKGYYWHSEKIRTNIFAGQQIEFKLEKRIIGIKKLNLYYEVSTHDLLLTQLATNNNLKPKDYLILSLGFGISFY